MSNQLFDNGDTLEKDGTKLECIGVTYRDVNDNKGVPTGEKENFVYSFRDQTEVKQERKDAENPEPTKPSEGERYGN